ncbi:hypothetical protein COHA_002815 [Chlorella ohadii]|uniref:Uncharacterized protein n=1 Tax=Chlorella ohadii TaxID=2649997 RepID=A0AAD5H7A7_9CHLO|nr:hypothetical protein COHA_002815 [Chlorella ohadii]
MSRQTRSAARRAEAAGGAWHELQEVLVCRIAGLLPIRERFGVLPLLNRHYHAISLRWPIGSGMGATQLFLPTGRLSSEGLAQRSQRLQAWLGRHSQQLRGLRCDLPVNIHQLNRDWEPALEGHAATLRAVLPAMEEALWQHRAALASLLLTGDKLAAAADDGTLADCTALESLTVLNYSGSADALAAAIAPLASLTRLEFAWGHGSPGKLLQAAPPAPLPSVLKAMLDCREFSVPLSGNNHWDVIGLAACSGLTRLDAAAQEFGGTAAKEANLSELQLVAYWSEVPVAVAGLPLTKLCLHHFHFKTDTLHQRFAGGFSREFTQLAPPLRELRLIDCSLVMLPAVVSTFTILTCLECATRLQELTLQADDKLDEPGQLANVEALNGLSSLTRLRLEHVQGAVLPPEGLYLSRLHSLHVVAFEQTTLPAGLAAATELTHLHLYSSSLCLTSNWEQLQQLLPNWPLLHEMTVLEKYEDLDPVEVLVGDLLANMS